MTSLDSILDIRPGVETAAFFVTWVAIALLAVIAVHLHLRLQRVERTALSTHQPVPYSRLVGQRLDSLLGGNRWQPGLMLFISSSCPTCDKVLADLLAASSSVPITLVYTSSRAVTPKWLPSNIRILEDGERVSSSLGIQVTPFAVIASENGIIAEAMPINSLEPIRGFVSATPEASAPHRIDPALEEVTP